MRIDKDLVAASATPLVLAILADSESYGYAILKRVRALSGGELEWTDGMLYPLLHRLRRLGYVTTEWRTPPEGRRRQYYMITDDGRAALAEQQRQWGAVTRALNDVWPGSGMLLRLSPRREPWRAWSHRSQNGGPTSRARPASTAATSTSSRIIFGTRWPS